MERDTLRLVLFHTHSRLAYLRYIVRGFFGVNWNIKGIELVDSAEAISRMKIVLRSPSRGHELPVGDRASTIITKGGQGLLRDVETA